jgi:DNA polymerase (family 10)
MARLNAAEIARLLREMGRRMQLQGGNPYRSKAYLRAADNLGLTTQPVEELIAQDRLQEIPGIGDALAGLIKQLHEAGQSPKLEGMRKEVPDGVLEMLRIPRLPADRIRKLHRELGIDSVAALEEAARTGQLAATKGFGAAFQAKVLQGIEMSRRPPGRHLHRAAMALDHAIAEVARTHPELQKLTPSGDFRRGLELVGSLSLAAVDPRGPSRNREIKAAEDLIVNITSEDRYGITLLLTTGSEEHIARLRSLARKKDLALDADGLRRGSRVIASATEEEIYAALGLPFIPPELRETGEEVERAQQGHLAELVSESDIRGVLHAHTDRSDGADTLHDMAEAARSRGYAYLGLTDHSQTASYAGGLKVNEVLQQQREVDRLNKQLGARFHVFKGIESDILADGSLDYPDDVLRSFDLIIASVHSRFRLGKQEQTKRILKAIRNPYTTILGHVTGRQLLRRPGYEVDMEAILQACAETGVAVEINAHPWRLDIDWRWCARGLELGCMFSIDPDAHSTDEFDNLRWGVLMARKGAVPKDRVINTIDARTFAAWLETRRQRAFPTSRKRKAAGVRG